MLWLLCVFQAVSMDSTDQGMLSSSMVDDTFFIVKKCVRLIHFMFLHHSHFSAKEQLNMGYVDACFVGSAMTIWGSTV